MKVTEAIEAALSAYVSKPASVLPFYLIGSSVAAVARVLPMFAAAAALAILAVQGRLDAFREQIAEIDFEAFDVGPDEQTPFDQEPGQVDPEQFPQEELPNEEIMQLLEAFDLLITPEVVALLGLSIVGAVAVWVILDAIVKAGQIHAVYGALRERRALTDGVSGLLDDALPFLGLRLLEIGLYLLASALFGVIFVGIAVVDSTLALVSLLVLAPLWGLAMLTILAVFLFAPQAIVIDRVGAIGGLRRGARFVVDRPIDFLAYGVIAIGVFAALAVASVSFAVVGVQQLSALLVMLVVTPVLDLVKTGIYADEESVLVPTFGDRETEGFVARIRDGSRRSLAELWTFTKQTPGLFAASIGLFALGGVAGWLAIGDVTLQMDAPTDPTQVFGTFPVDTFVYLAANNWQVSVVQSFSGFALGIPTAVSLLFNGFIVGLVTGIGHDPVVLVALIAPHGIIEIPALAISGALGLYLGVVGWRRARGRATDDDVAAAIERAFWVLVGIAFVLIVAAAIEAFVTPWVGAAVA